MKDTSPEMRRLQFEVMMGLGLTRRVELAGEMFMAARNMLLASLPSDISERERIRRIYRATYRTELPQDFFKDDKP